MQVQPRAAVAETDLAAAGDEERVRRRARGDRERHLRSGDVLDGELAGAAAGVVGGELPIVVRAAGRRRCVVELDAGVVLLEADGVEAEALVVDAVETDTQAALNDCVVGSDHVLGLRRARRQTVGDDLLAARRGRFFCLRRHERSAHDREASGERRLAVETRLGADVRDRIVVAGFARGGELLLRLRGDARNHAQLPRV